MMGGPATFSGAERDRPPPSAPPQGMEHFLDLWRLLRITADIETINLEVKYSLPTQIAVVIEDILRDTELARVDIRVRVPEHIVQAPAAAIITQSFPKDIHYGEDRDPPHIAAGRIAHIFKNLYRYLWDALGKEREETILRRDARDIDYVRPIHIDLVADLVKDAILENEGDPDGVGDDLAEIPADIEILRLHEDRRTLSYPLPADRARISSWENVYQEEDGSLWRKVRLGHFHPGDRWIRDMLPEETSRIAFHTIQTEAVRRYDYRHKDGRIETIRLHDKGRQLSRLITADNIKTSYVDIDGRKWEKAFSSAVSTGFNNIGFDSRVFKQFGFLALLPNIIFDRLKQNHLFQSDVRAALKAAVAFNNRGEQGVQPGRAVNPETGESYVSFGLSSTMDANGPQQHGFELCLRMPDGSLYERRLGHVDALYDIVATIALDRFMRGRDPEVMRRLDLNADHEKFINFLVGEKGFEDHPLRAFVRDNYPHTPTVHVGVCVGVDQQIKEIRQALLVRTDIPVPLEKYQYKGRYLFGDEQTPPDQLMTQADIQKMMQDYAENPSPDSIFKIINTRKNHLVFEEGLAYERGKIAAPAPDAVSAPQWQARQRLAIRNSFLHRKRDEILMAAMQAVTTSFPGASEGDVTRVEEETHTHFQKPKQLYLRAEEGLIAVPDVLNTHALNSWEQKIGIAHVLKTVLGGLEPLEWLKDIPKDDHREVLQDFWDKITKAKKDLARYQTRYAENPITLVEPDEGTKPRTPQDGILVSAYCRDALDYLWKLRAAHQADIPDITNVCRVYDRFGHEVSSGELHALHREILEKRLSSGEYRVEFEELKHSSQLVARMFLTTPGRMEWIKTRLARRISVVDADLANLKPEASPDARKRLVEEREVYAHELHRWHGWEQWYAAEAARHLWGPPDAGPREHKWMSGLKALEENKDMRENRRAGLDQRAVYEELGLNEIYMSNRDQSDEILDQHAQHVGEMLDKNPFTPERRLLMGYHAEDSALGLKNRPMEAVKYEITARRAIALDVPDGLLQSPLQHVEIGRNIVPVIVPHDLDLKTVLEAKDTALLFRAPESGKIFFAAKAVYLDEIEPRPWFGELYATADKGYADAGQRPVSGDPRLAWIKIERPPYETPIALVPPPGRMQTIKMRDPDFFDGAVSTALSHKSRLLTGCIMRLDTVPPKLGPALMTEMTRRPGNDNFAETGWVRRIDITRVQELTLQEFVGLIGRSIKFDAAMTALRASTPQDVVKHIGDENTAKKFKFKNLGEVAKEMALGVLTREDILRMGYDSFEDARSKVRHKFADKERNQASPDEKVVMVDFTADKASTTRRDPARRMKMPPDEKRIAPIAAFDPPLSPENARRLRESPGVVLAL